MRSILTNEKYKGEALLQKTFSYDYLSKTRKKNDGSVKQYYVKNSHPAIIEPELFDLVQDKLRKNKAVSGKTNSSSPFAAKIVCGDCGGFYGRKTLRRRHGRVDLVWYCNRRYEREETCMTPIIKEEVLQQAFEEAMRKVLANREDIKDGEEGDGCENESKNGTENKDKSRDSLAVLNEKVEKARVAAQEATIRLEQYRNEHRESDSEESRREYEGQLQKVLDKRKAIELAEDEVAQYKALEMKKRMFREKTDGLRGAEVRFRDDLFMETVERIYVSSLRGDKYTLKFLFMNGEPVKIERVR